MYSNEPILIQQISNGFLVTLPYLNQNNEIDMSNIDGLKRAATLMKKEFELDPVLKEIEENNFERKQISLKDLKIENTIYFKSFELVMNFLKNQMHNE